MDSTNRPPAGREALPSPDDVLIVGIGASAGGIEAIQSFFEGLPEDLEGVAFVIVMHLDPERESSLAEVLQHRTSMTVRQLTERQKVEAGTVYVIPPNKSLSVVDGHISVEAFAQPHGRRAPIDLFFRSLADSPGGGIGIAMSGGGSDGAVGLKAVEEAGGLVMVQDPHEAAHDSMPLSVIATGLVDFVLPARELAVKVAEFRRSWGAIQVPEQRTRLPEDELGALDDILGLLRDRTGHDFSDYKDSTVLRRIERRMQVHHVESLRKYLEFLRTHHLEAQALLKSLLITVTQFFRDGASWDALAEKIIPELLEGDLEESVRVWVPGCATGEEAYSIGMLLAERAADVAQAPDFQIFASDLDEEALAFARRGVYPEAIEADVSEERLQRFFSREGHHYRVNEELRGRVLFASHNLLKDPPFSRLHLVTCRNLLIYLDRPLQRKVFQIFEYALRPGGYLFLGSAESVDGGTGAFQSADKKHRIYRREDTGEPVRLPDLAFDTRFVDKRRIGSARAIGQRGTLPSNELERHQELLENHAPPSIVVTADHTILHLSESAGRFLERPGGRPSSDILREIRSELRLDLQMALSEAFDAGRSTSTRPIKVRFNGDASWVHIIVQPGHGDTDTDDRALVLFAEVEATDIGHGGDAEGPTETERGLLVHRLEEETRRLRDRLHATIEQHESSKEEMKAANEELQSMNEEYKSTAEELETSKEELQSVNEELTTVNLELEDKVEELAQANSDLQNLMAATEVGTLFLDRDLRIQRYTPHITELFNVIVDDVGRSITHLTHDLEYEHLVEDAELVLDNLVPLEREVRGRRGAWFLMRMRPYRTMRDQIDGVVVTFVDITRRLEEEQARRKAEERYRILVESIEEYAIVLLDAEGRIATWNVGAERLFGYDESEALGQPGAIIYTAEDREAGAPEENLAAAAEHESVSDERWYVRKDGSRFWGSGMMTALHLPDGDLRGFAKGMGDHTERKRAEEELKELTDSLEQRVEQRTNEVRELASSLTMAEQHERTRIARILHSDLQQMLYSIQLKLALVREALDDTGAAPAGVHLSESEEWLDRALATTRQLTVELSPPVLDREGLTDALAWLRTHMLELHDIEVEIVADGPFDLPDEDWRMLLFQAVRELLFNVVKHAGTNRATVELSEREDEIVIRVVDEGRGFDVSSIAGRSVDDSSVGLLSLGERLRLFGGRLEIESTPGSGTRASLHAPIEPRQSYAGGAGAADEEGPS
ncbi:MAG TPA: CheR family methyltransferase [Gemmatimonadota bacterium]|nr:CheR family methyltransferase [Gemmatimonadota bacterium]